MNQRSGQEIQEQTVTVRIAEMGVVRSRSVERRAGGDRRSGGTQGGGGERRAGTERRTTSDQGGHSVLKTTLGSCVGVILSDPVNGVHGLAHVMLPERLGADTATGKYADTAVPALVAEMERSGGARRTMEAFLVGGASMFQTADASCLPKIGEKNVETVVRVLGQLGIPVVFRETGGTAGRTVIFDCADRVPRVKTLTGVPQA